MRLRVEWLVEPALELSRPVDRDRVSAPVGAVGALDAFDPDAAALLEPAQGRIDLGEGDRVVRREVAVDQVLQVVAVPRLLLEEPKEGVWNAHGPHYKPSL